MKKILLLSVVCFIGYFSLNAQKKDTPIMSYWSGGQINLDLKSSINTMGGGQGAGGFGRVIAPGVSYGPASIFTNPAELGLIKAPIFYFDSKLSISLSTLGYDATKELNKSMTTATTTFLKDETTFKFDKVTNDRTDTKFNKFDFGQTSQFGSFALAVPIKDKFVLGFGVTYPIELNSDFLLAGARTKITSQKIVSGQTITIDLPLSINFASNFRFNVNMISMGVAGEVLNNKYGTTFAGFSVNRYDVTQFVNINLRIDGMMVIKKKLEYHFNDPNDPNIDRAAGESNDFYWLARGNYKAEGWGFRAGVIQKYENYNFVAALDIVPKFKLTDKDFINKSYQPKFIKGRALGESKKVDGKEVGDVLDIVIDSLDLAKPNLTVPGNNPFSESAETVYPSTLTLGADAKFGRFTFGLNYVKYLSEFSFKFAGYKLGKDCNSAVKFSFDVQLPDTVRKWGYLMVIPRLFFDFDGVLFQLLQQGFKIKAIKYKNPRYRVEGGVMFGKSIVEGITDEKQLKSTKETFDMPLPTGFAFSKEYSLFDKVNVSVMIFGFPDFALRFGIGYLL